MMLADQGQDDNELNRFLIEQATFSPVRLYFSLLFAEIDAIESCSRGITSMRDPTLAQWLRSRNGDIRLLKGFRDTFIHPQSATASAEQALLHSGLHNRIPGLQRELDTALIRVRATIGGRMFAIFNGLPLAQQCYLLRQFSSIPLSCWLDAAYSWSDHDRQREGDALRARIERAADADLLWSPGAEEARVAKKMSDLVSSLMPFVPDNPLPDFGARLPPFTVDHLAPLLNTGGGVPHLSQGQRIRHVYANIGHYKRNLIVVGVLFNELEHARTQAADRTPTVDEQMVMAALPKAAFALLCNYLQYYVDVAAKNPWAAVPDLDELLRDRTLCVAFRRFRNSVFHVAKLGHDPSAADREALEFDAPDVLASVYRGLCRFLTTISNDNCPVS